MTFEQFASQNIFWFSLLAFVIGLIIVYEFRNRGVNTFIASPMAAAQLSNKGAILIDIRPPADYRKGHIASSKNIPGDLFNQKIESSKIQKEQQIVIICKNGVSAQTQAKWLRTQGYNNVYLLEGGIDAWQQENLPLVK